MKSCRTYAYTWIFILISIIIHDFHHELHHSRSVWFLVHRGSCSCLLLRCDNINGLGERFHGAWRDGMLTWSTETSKKSNIILQHIEYTILSIAYNWSTLNWIAYHASHRASPQLEEGVLSRNFLGHGVVAVVPRSWRPSRRNSILLLPPLNHSKRHLNELPWWLAIS